MAVTTKKKEIMAITIYQGVITAIDEFGNIVYYRQKGITNAPKEKIAKAIQMGLLTIIFWIYQNCQVTTR